MRKIALLVCAVLTAGLLAGCGADGIQVTATFEDVGDLAIQAPVTMADIQIGEVTSIKLAGVEAVVSMSLDPDAKVPAGVSARVRRTSVLGERIVDIVLPEDTSGTATLLTDGAHIEATAVRSDLEDLVAEGSDVFGAVSASQLAVMIEEGAKGFGNRGPELAQLLKNYRDIVGAYAGRSEQIVDLIGSMKRFNETIAARAEQHAKSVVNTAKAIGVLEEESLRLEKAVISLARLAKGGRSILDEHVGTMDRFFSQLRIILGAIEDEQRSLRLFLRWAPGHNYNTQAVEYTEFNQVIQDFVICGLNDDSKNKARTCERDGE
jgi:phospholipid/cholesterol/gamma-HCH transport system substrate-binding protein